MSRLQLRTIQMLETKLVVYSISDGGKPTAYIILTFLATKSTTSRAAAKQPAAILAVTRFVDARMKTIPQNDEPRSGRKNQAQELSVTL